VNPSQNLVSPRITGWVDNVNDVHPKRWVCFRDQQGSIADRRKP